MFSFFFFLSSFFCSACSLSVSLCLHLPFFFYSCSLSLGIFFFLFSVICFVPLFLQCFCNIYSLGHFNILLCMLVLFCYLLNFLFSVIFNTICFLLKFLFPQNFSPYSLFSNFLYMLLPILLTSRTTSSQNESQVYSVFNLFVLYLCFCHKLPHRLPCVWHIFG